MNGWQTVYLCFPDRDTAFALATQLGAGIDSEDLSGGSENYCFTAYTAAPGREDATWPFPVLARFNTDRPPGAAAYAAVLATPYVRTPAGASNGWAGQ